MLLDVIVNAAVGLGVLVCVIVFVDVGIGVCVGGFFVRVPVYATLNLVAVGITSDVLQETTSAATATKTR